MEGNKGSEVEKALDQKILSCEMEEGHEMECMKRQKEKEETSEDEIDVDPKQLRLVYQVLRLFYLEQRFKDREERRALSMRKRKVKILVKKIKMLRIKTIGKKWQSWAKGN